MSTMTLEVNDGIHLLNLDEGDTGNTFTLKVLQEYLAALDEVERYEGNTALMISCDHPKTFSTGINLEWLLGQSEAEINDFVKTLEILFYRLAMLNAPTVAAINGNCYAGGAIMVSAMDFRFMRSDRGRFCYPEVDIKIPFTPMMNDIIHLLPNKHVLKSMALLGQAYSGEECLQASIVDGLHTQETLQTETFKFAKHLATKDRVTYTTIKQRMRGAIAAHKQVIFG